ncbi:hypothetical protein VB834_00505 [Limnoraphis robusta Tam1]|uniref:hypothetical protein n=1 Tax=Limnoraphis robusta TaxID=1118279 RepID=UPI002B217031|nr:hypothetical protein [Limnoraphis robusta]MEA5537504.1 hypothetical protein [Limnoraphis robusta Tam1]
MPQVKAIASDHERERIFANIKLVNALNLLNQRLNEPNCLKLNLLCCVEFLCEPISVGFLGKPKRSPTPRQWKAMIRVLKIQSMEEITDDLGPVDLTDN